MKKWLILFVIVDFVFVGLVLRVSTQNEQRQIASVNQEGDLTEGQQRKVDLVKSIQFKSDLNELLITSDRLQMICETSDAIEVKYIAVNVAYAGVQPTISHSFSCADIKKNQAVSALQTALQDFKSMHTQKELKLETSQLTASQVYRDEEFPSEWKLAEIKVIGPSTFTINQFELEKVHSAGSFDFIVRRK